MRAKTLEELIALGRHIQMTPEEKEAQRRSFAYGNLKLANPSATKELIDEAAEELAHKKQKTHGL